MTYPRALSESERDVLEFLLADPDERLAPLRLQAETAIVTGACHCGCPTISLGVDSTLPPARLASPAVESHSRDRAEDNPMSSVGLILFLDEGFLSELELWYVSSAPPPRFPATSTLEAPRIIG